MEYFRVISLAFVCALLLFFSFSDKEEVRENFPSPSELLDIKASIPESISHRNNFQASVNSDTVLTIKYQEKNRDYKLLVFEGKFSPGNLRKRETYYPNGKIKSYEYFNDYGQRSGVNKEYYLNGCVKLNVLYERGKYNGMATEYYENCNRLNQMNYVEGVPHGVDSTWFATGEIKEVFKYSYGDLIDTGSVYDIDGSIDTLYVFKENRLVTKIPKAE